MVMIYASDISKLSDPKEVPQIMEGLPQARKDKLQRCLMADKRKQSLGAGLLLEHVLKIYGKCSLDIHIGKNGKPELDGLYFNLSHAGEIAICAVSDKPVGCDVEQITVEPKQIAKRYFCESENQYLDALDGKEREKEFFRIWTWKESYMKMTGEGMSLALNRIEFVMEENVKVYRDGKLCPCAIKEYAIPGYKCSVCSEDIEFAGELCWVKIPRQASKNPIAKGDF